MEGEDARAMIVVGVDGSAGSVEALRWAINYARATKAEVHALMAWELPTTYGYAPTYDDFDWAKAAQQKLDQAVDPQRDSVKLSTELVHGCAADVLIKASQDADLLVVGSRGHGTVAGLLLGSVSQHCVHHSACPVLVVPPASGGRQRNRT